MPAQACISIYAKGRAVLDAQPSCMLFAKFYGVERFTIGHGAGTVRSAQSCDHPTHMHILDRSCDFVN